MILDTFNEGRIVKDTSLAVKPTHERYQQVESLVKGGLDVIAQYQEKIDQQYANIGEIIRGYVAEQQPTWNKINELQKKVPDLWARFGLRDNFYQVSSGTEIYLWIELTTGTLNESYSVTQGATWREHRIATDEIIKQKLRDSPIFGQSLKLSKLNAQSLLNLVQEELAQ